jgi:thiosulfate dehydrogenase [quinone] large subunit
MQANIVTRKGNVVKDPPFARFLFNDLRMSVVWLVLRLWLGYKWIDAGLHKIENPAWVQTGEALKGFWSGIVVVPADGRPPIAFDWYRGFIQTLLDAQAYTWFAKLVAYGELIIGIALILGIFTGIAAFFGAFMNWNFMMAGSASVNPMLFVISIGLVLGWKVAGYLGVDYFLLPALGTPWQSEATTETETQESGGLQSIPATGD